jgi:hypothetical protein
MHLGTHVFFFFFFWGGGCWTFVVPNVLPWNSHYVVIKFLMSSQTCFPSFQCVPSHVLNNSSFYLISFPPRSKFHSCNLYQQLKGGDYNISILGLCKAWLILLWWANQRCPWQKKNKSNLGIPITN